MQLPSVLRPAPYRTCSVQRSNVPFRHTGGLIGYHLAKERYADPASPAHQQSWSSAWSNRCEQRRADRWAQSSAANAGGKSQAPNVAVNDSEYAAFLKWKAAQQSPPYADAMRAGAVENADKALDAVMAQVQVLKEVSNLVDANSRWIADLTCAPMPSAEARPAQERHPAGEVVREQPSDRSGRLQVCIVMYALVLACFGLHPQLESPLLVAPPFANMSLSALLPHKCGQVERALCLCFHH